MGGRVYLEWTYLSFAKKFLLMLSLSFPVSSYQFRPSTVETLVKIHGQPRSGDFDPWPCEDFPGPQARELKLSGSFTAWVLAGSPASGRSGVPLDGFNRGFFLGGSSWGCTLDGFNHVFFKVETLGWFTLDGVQPWFLRW